MCPAPGAVPGHPRHAGATPRVSEGSVRTGEAGEGRGRTGRSKRDHLGKAGEKHVLEQEPQELKTQSRDCPRYVLETVQELEAWMSRTFRMEDREPRAGDVRTPRSGWEQWEQKGRSPQVKEQEGKTKITGT